MANYLHSVPVGEPGGGLFMGTVRDSNIWAPFSWTQMMLGV